MLDELKNIKNFGGKEELILFFSNAISNNQIKICDIESICLNSYGKHYLSIKNLIKYCCVFKWICVSNDIVAIEPIIMPFFNDKEKLNDTLIISTISQLFDNDILTAKMFYYDTVLNCYGFKNELFPLYLSTIRNVLISQGFLSCIKNDNIVKFYVSPKYEWLVVKYCNIKQKQLSLEELKKQLENNDIIGEKAEKFVLDFERKRVGQPLSEKIKRISEIDVAAGYDIVSFNSTNSITIDRYIEVKAVSKRGFCLTKNEFNIAKLFGEQYFLYLVRLDCIYQEDYIPEIICNPVRNIFESDDWVIESQSFYICKIR